MLFRLIQCRFNPVVTRRVGVAFLTIGVLGVLARMYIASVKGMMHGTVADFLLGLIFGVGLPLSLVASWRQPEQE